MECLRHTAGGNEGGLADKKYRGQHEDVVHIIVCDGEVGVDTDVRNVHR